MAPSPLVLVTVGTDHHPFDRLMRWTTDWLEARGRDRARVIVQHGSAAPPPGTEASTRLPPAELAGLMADAGAVVCHGGPGTIVECRRLGLTPIVVPRRAAARECVDDHQVAFARRLAADGQVELAETEARFMDLLDRAVRDPASFRAPSPAADRDSAARVFEGLVDAVAPPAGTRSLTVLYVGGWGRSGSTLLDRLVGQLPGFVSIGETRDLWLRGPIENRRCGCGRPFLECSFWTAVGDRAFGGWRRGEAESLLRFRNAIDRPWTALLLAIAPTLPASATTYLQALERLYRAVREVSGSSVIVESSKIPSYAMLLGRIPGMDLRVVHLVRDSRGVAFSWQRRVVRTDSTERHEGVGRPDLMRRYGPLSASLRYLAYNGLTEALRLKGHPYLRLRYEDLVAAPRDALLRILHSAPGASPPLPMEDGHAVLTPNHTVDGNPMRFSSGRVPLRLDDEWRQGMSASRRRLVTLATLPLLRRYGYQVGSDHGS